MMLSAEALTRAREFLRTQGRPLDQACYCFHFGCTPPIDARVALGAFQNGDGGFGRALEPDFRLPASSAAATAIGFELMREIGVLADDPMARTAVRWTQAAFDRALGRWPATPRAVNDRPHAPWWTWTPPRTSGFTLNPGAELVAHLWHYSALADPEFLADVTDRIEARVGAMPPEPPMHDLLCLIHLAESPAVPAVLRTKAADHARRAGPAVVAREPGAWSGYVAKPLFLAPRADSLLAPLLADEIAANLDFEIARQDRDGSWSPNWNWGGAYPSAWRQAEREWKSVLTLRTLLSLRSYGRLPALGHEAVAPSYSLAKG